MDTQESQQRPRGRPRVADPQERISTRVPTEYYDRLNQLANRRGESMSQLVRSLIITRLKTTNGR